MMTMCLAAAVASGHLHRSSESGVGSLVYLTDADSRALCLDGSPGAMYVIPSQSTDPAASENWMVFYQGGGLCTSNATCLERSFTTLGSSKQYPPQYPESQLTGLLSRNCSINPQFCDFNVAHVMYCDGFLWSGGRYDNYTVDGKNLYFRGDAVRRAAYKALVQAQPGFAAAKRVMIAGCSAGAMGTFLHSSDDAEYARSLSPALATADFRAVPLSGMFLTLTNAEWQQIVLALLLDMLPVANASMSFDRACLASAPPAARYLCASSLGSWAYSRVPTFMVQSKTDHWQVTCTLLSEPVPGAEECLAIPAYARSGCGGHGNFARCNSTLIRPILAFQQTFEAHVFGNRGFTNPGSGTFLSSCYTHCEGLGDQYWSTVTINGVTMSQAVRWWWNNATGQPASTHTYVDCARPDTPPYVCNPTCQESN